MIANKKILIYGGSGSLGNQLVQRYMDNNQIVVYSRDECKHWKMGLKYKSKKIEYVIGNIADKNRVEETLVRIKPDIMIIAAAMKHIDRCEYASNECLNSNLLGIKYILDAVEKFQDDLPNLESVCFVSTDKACSPINLYGVSKAASEMLMIEKSYYLKGIKFVGVRYGNVLNSRGSIIPILHTKGRDPNVKEFTLTHPDMTRFVMTLDQSVDLIEHAILHAGSGDIVIPKLISMTVSDLLEIFSEMYNKPVRVTGLRPGEKMLESLINETQSMRLVRNGEYSYIKPPYHSKLYSDEKHDYNSTINPLNKEELRQYLLDLKLIGPDFL